MGFGVVSMLVCVKGFKFKEYICKQGRPKAKAKKGSSGVKPGTKGKILAGIPYELGCWTTLDGINTLTDFWTSSR